jgi:hypothetical protein
VSNNRRFFNCADITFQVESDLPILDTTFTHAINQFEVDNPGGDVVTIRHHFSLPDLSHKDFGNEIYRKVPWAIYKDSVSWYYTIISPTIGDNSIYKLGIFNESYTIGQIYNRGEEDYLSGNWNSITMFPTDQILISQLLANRNGLYLHSAGAILNNKGFLFVGHSEAGKSTTTKLLMDVSVDKNNSAAFQTEILCDDRNIVRRGYTGWRVYGSWSHGDIPDVSPSSSSLNAICFIEKADHNEINILVDQKEIRHRLMSYVIKALVTQDWWNKTLDSIETLAHEVPCYIMQFDKSGKIIPKIADLIKENNY